MAGVRVDDVMVAHALFLEEPLIVPRGRDGGIDERNTRDHVAFALGRIAHADHPGLAESVADDAAVAAGADERARIAELFEHVDAAIDGVALGDAAEIDPHALLGEPHRLILRVQESHVES